MTQLVRVQNFMLSTDGFGSGEGQSLERPFGHANPAELAAWAGATASWPNRTDPGGTRGLDDYFTRDFYRNIGAEIMGRNKFGPQRGEWENLDWKGWWGEEPPYHCPVFVLTHHARDPIEMQGGTTFYFVTDGIESAYARARTVAGGRDISIAGGAACARQAIRAGLVDEIDLQVNPLILGSGERLFDGFEAGRPTLELARVLEAPGVVHLRYRVIAAGD